MIDKYSRHPEIEKRGYLATKYLTLGRAAIAEKNWQQALIYLKYAEQMAPSVSNTTEIAKCLAELGKETESLSYLHKHNGEKDTRSKITILIRLGRKKEALKLTRSLKCGNWDDGTTLIKARFLDQLGQHDEALEITEAAYIRAVRQCQPTETFESYFKEFQVAPPGPDRTKRSSTDNAAALELIEKIARPEPPAKTISGMKALFHKDFYAAIKSDSKIMGVHTTEDTQGPLPLVSYDFSQITEPQHITLRCSINSDSTTLTEEDIGSLCNRLGYRREALSPEEANYLLYRTNFGEIGFTLCPCKPNYVSGIDISWNDPTYDPRKREEQEASRSRAWIKAEAEQANAAIAAGHFKQALPHLFQCFLNRNQDQSLAPLEKYKAQLARKELIERCYEGLRKDEIVQYLRRAPLDVIYGDVLMASTENSDLPGIYDFLKRQWNVGGSQESASRGCYQITIPGSGMTVICENSPLYPVFWKLIGRIENTGDGRDIFPLPPALIDAESWQIPLEEAEKCRPDYPGLQSNR